jgi:hypothetical protein
MVYLRVGCACLIRKISTDMKTMIRVVSLVLCASSLMLWARTTKAQQQPPNAGFENWVNADSLVDWVLGDRNINGTEYATVTQSSDAHSGSSAMQAEVLALTAGPVTVAIPPAALTGSNSARPGFPYTDQPTTFSGYYKYTPVGGDSMFIDVAFSKAGTGIGGGAFATAVGTSSYTPFSVPIYWLQGAGSPDSAIIAVSIHASNGAKSTNPGSKIILDDIAFANGDAGVESKSTQTNFQLEQSFPNPALNCTTLSYSLSENGFAKLEVFDVTGRIVATPLAGYETVGKHSATLNAAVLSDGIYSYKLTSGAHTSVRMMQVLH